MTYLKFGLKNNQEIYYEYLQLLLEDFSHLIWYYSGLNIELSLLRNYCLNYLEAYYCLKNKKMKCPDNIKNFFDENLVLQKVNKQDIKPENIEYFYICMDSNNNKEIGTNFNF